MLAKCSFAARAYMQSQVGQYASDAGSDTAFVNLVASKKVERKLEEAEEAVLKDEAESEE
jgi:hypothetical protein